MTEEKIKEERYKKYVRLSKRIGKEIDADRFEVKGERGGYLVFSTKYGDKVINLCM